MENETKIINRNTGIGFDPITFTEPIPNSTDILKATCTSSFYDYTNNRIENTIKVDIYNSEDVFQSTSYVSYITTNVDGIYEIEVNAQGEWIKDLETLEEPYNRIDQLNDAFSSQIKPLIIDGMKKLLGY